MTFNTTVISILGSALLLLSLACSPSAAKATVEKEGHSPGMEVRDLDTMEITAARITPEIEERIRALEERVYEGTYEKRARLIHTFLDLSFGWEERTISGEAVLTLTPYFYDLSELRLDAKNFDIYRISKGPDGEELDYNYDGVELYIDLGTTYTRGDTFDIYLDYKAFPYRQRPDGFQPAAIQRGIYFVNYTGEDLYKPMQIWTQGQTEYNSNWFPTIDKPNVRTTQEMVITVDDRFTTLTNGLLVESEALDNGMRKDRFVLDMDHPPYLFMLAISEDYVVVEDEWRGVPIEYIVESDYEQYAADIFGNTLEMMDFFSEKTGIDYPWPKYSQVVVRDFVAGAMENTTAVIYGEQVQRPKIDLEDSNNDGIVAHELIHHWFGNMVTCENWASLTLNEGFASFTEYLWEEYKYGADRAGELRLDKLQAYFNETVNYVRPLINFGYDDNEEMFDRHTYNKGGLVLQMLRDFVGDDAFFASWNKYLIDNIYSAVEVHDLRLAFEEVTGKDLNWFFDQWFFKKGHPQMFLEKQYDSGSGTLGVTISQVQDPVEWHPVFQFPLRVDIYLENGSVIELDVFIDQRETVFLLDCPSPPVWVNFDPDKFLLAEFDMERDFDSYLAQYQLASSFQDRHQAVMALRSYASDIPSEVRNSFLEDGSGRIRHAALSAFGNYYLPDREDRLVEMVLTDESSLVRATALEILEMFDHSNIRSLAREVLEAGYSAATISAALEALYHRSPEEAIELAALYENTLSRTVLMTLATLYGTYGSEDHLSFFKTNYYKPRGFAISNFFSRFSDLLFQLDEEVAYQEADWLIGRAMDSRQGTFVRYGATSSLVAMSERFKGVLEAGEGDPDFLKSAVESLDESVAKILETERNPRVRTMIENLIGN